MSLSHVCLKKGEDRRIRAGHPWIFSNEINTLATPLRQFTPGQEVFISSHDHTLLGVAYINPRSLIVARIFSRDLNQRLTLDFFIDKLKQALALRMRMFDQPYYRWVFSEADELPGLVIDRFGQDFVVQINTAGMEVHQLIIGEALRTIVPDLHSILLRNDSAIREHEGLTAYIKPLFGQPPASINIEENGTFFSAPLLTGQKTGWFYDHRLNRARLQMYVKQATVLDVFSYLGGFGIQAAVFGANKVDCIEASASACDYILTNATLNGVADRVHPLCEDAFDAMKRLIQAHHQYDVIILDPPAFVKRFKDRQEGCIAYQRINELALKLLSRGGILVSCSCSMHISFEDLMEIMRRAAFRTQSTIQVLERGHQGPDHPIHIVIPETDYLKALFVRKM